MRALWGSWCGASEVGVVVPLLCKPFWFPDDVWGEILSFFPPLKCRRTQAIRCVLFHTAMPYSTNHTQWKGPLITVQFLQYHRKWVYDVLGSTEVDRLVREEDQRWRD